MNTEKLIKKIIKERNGSKNTWKVYTLSIKNYEKFNNMNFIDLLNEAKKEENTTWNNTILKKRLMNYREYLYRTYKKNTAMLYLTVIISTYRHLGVNVQTLPYFSMKTVKTNPPIYYDDLPDKNVLKTVIGITSPVLTAITLFISSSGCSRVDTLNITIHEYINATYEYHHQQDIYKAINVMDSLNYQIIPTFYLKRQKTGKQYFTFCSDEAVRAINSYLKTRKSLKGDLPLFKINGVYLNKRFKEINDKLGLGNRGDYARFRPHMLRKYHASMLYEAGMDKYKIDQLQGRSKEKVHEAYFKDSPSSLKEEYINCLPNLVVTDYEEVKTELEVKTEETKTLQDKLTNQNVIISEILERVNNLENETLTHENVKKLKRIYK
ncbi:tyrosine-type recombinase/integrase [uncultured Methanobrevibacter sp.]|uniref:tyrosine-type recombinase/integrase n=1 Tax=uncultured Methanobrevibacter sp. TaxID=253161 RepID=UPI002635DAB9|nr:tyrosine-type recombinase/integrase [uncultured Methanobrevibacter sp.]